MERIELNKIQRYIFYSVLYVLTVGAVFLMLPGSSKVEQYYEVGKPWNYDALIAPVDFPIYKSEQRIANERDSLDRFLVPYMIMDSVEMVAALNSLEMLSTEGTNERAYRDLLLMMIKVYNDGIVSSEDKEWFESLGISSIYVIAPDFSTTEKQISSLRTVSEVYNALTKAMVKIGYDEATVKRFRISRFISINLKLDKSKTDAAKKELEASVLPTSGMVIQGEKIIDKGELVTEKKAQVLNSLKKVTRDDKVEKSTGWSIGAHILLLAIFYALLWGYLILFRTKIFRSARETLFLMLSSVLMLALFTLLVSFLKFSEYIVPMAMLPLVVRVFFDSRTALYVHIVTILAASMIVDNPSEFMIIELITGMVAVLSLKDINNRKQLMRAALYVFCTYTIVFVSLRLSMGIGLQEINWWTTGTFFLNALSLLLTYGVIFLVEKTFGFISDVSLVELASVNNPLITQFANKCPGTFQHVAQVNNLARHVAAKVGANHLLVSAGAMYHDLGKMNNPMVFTENRTPGVNPLANLSLEESAEIIIRHVEDGVKIAKKHSLPFPIIEFILTHHGTSKTKYFYNQWINEHPGQTPPEDKFTYKGPKPRTKETVILMMADSIEAASRSLKEYNEETISDLVEKIVSSQIMDGQFSDAPITFRDVQIAKKSFKEEILNIYHSRISYPEIKDEKGKTPMQLAKEINISFPRRFTKR